MTSSEATTPPTTWAHFQKPLFGIADLLIPQGINLQVSKEVFKEHVLVGDANDPSRLRLDFRLGYDNAHVESYVKYVKTLAESEAPDLHKTIQPMADVDFGIAIGDGVSKACLKYFSGSEAEGTDAAVPEEATYMAVVKSPFEHGLFIQISGAPENPETVAQTAKSIIGSLKWVDRRTIVEDVSSRFVGSWNAYRPLPFQRYPGCTSCDSKTFNYAANGTYTAEHIVEHIAKSGKVQYSDSGYIFPGTWKAYQSADKWVQLLKRGVGDEVQNVKFLDGWDKFEIEPTKVVYVRVGSAAWSRADGKKKQSAGFLRKVKHMFK